jgi:hypothetical protein
MIEPFANSSHSGATPRTGGVDLSDREGGSISTRSNLLTNSTYSAYCTHRPSVDGLFLHAMFRTGSTYLFHKLRSLSSQLICYQESLHEMTVLANNDPLLLLQDAGRQKAFRLRHPVLRRPYFQELHDAWPLWQNTLAIESVYHRFFDQSFDDHLGAFFHSLFTSARRRPVFCETRTHFRIKPLRDLFGGTHVYLWRNPWDQWWSYQVEPYFNAILYLLAYVPSAPHALQRVCTFYQIPAIGSTDAVSICQSPSSFRLTAEESYALFYTFWLLSLAYARRHADGLINIDRLSTCNSYRASVSARLCTIDGKQIDFSDCAVPRGVYGRSERAFFRAIERRVRTLLLPEEMDAVSWIRTQHIRSKYSPHRYSASPATALLASHDSHTDSIRATHRRVLSQSVTAYRLLAASACELRESAKRANEAAHISQERLAEDRQSHALASTTIESQRNQLLSNALAIASLRDRLTKAELLAQQHSDCLQLLHCDNARLLSERDALQGVLSKKQRDFDVLAAKFEVTARHLSESNREAAAAAANALHWQRNIKALREENSGLCAAASQSLRYQREASDAMKMLAAERILASAARLREAATASERTAIANAISRLWDTVVSASGSQAAIAPESDLSALCATHAKLAELCHSSHVWHLEAIRHRETVDALLRSNSWQATAPLRAAGTILRSAASVGQRSLYAGMTFPRTVLRHAVVRVMRYVLQRPPLLNFLKPTVKHYPWLKHRLRALAVSHGLIALPQGVLCKDLPVAMPTKYKSLPLLSDDSAVLRHLGPRARIVYKELLNYLPKPEQEPT